MISSHVKSGASCHVAVACHAWYEDDFGGSFRLASEFAEFLARRGHPVTFVCCAPKTNSTLPPREMIRGVVVRRYRPPAEWLPRMARLRHHVHQTGRCVDEAACERSIDILCGHTPLQFLGAARKLRQAAFKTFFVHSPLDDELLSNSSGRVGWQRRLRARLGRWVDGRCVALADRVHTASRYTLESMIEKHGPAVGNKGVVAPGWVDADRFRPIVDRTAARRRLDGHWNTDQPIFFTLRRHEARMGLDTLIDAVDRLARCARPFRVLIGGDGSLRPLLEQRVRDLRLEGTVKFLGRLAEDQIPDCYAAADCFVLPTRALECFGLIVLESFASGTPVIAARVAAIPELAQVQGDDWLFEAGNSADLALHMEAFLAGKLTAQADIRAFAERFHRSSVLEQWSELILSDNR
jgi:glycosyltransferase involved in cell wall biosynthesis